MGRGASVVCCQIPCTGIPWPQSWQRPEILLGPVLVLPGRREAIPLPGRMPQLGLRGSGSRRKAAPTVASQSSDCSPPFLSQYAQSDRITLQLNAHHTATSHFAQIKAPVLALVDQASLIWPLLPTSLTSYPVSAPLPLPPLQPR